jgi:divalent metal cation (Fe/Co/Zn/Cd) transporter
LVALDNNTQQYKMMTSKEQTTIRTIYFSIAGNISLAVIKSLAGFFGNSNALIANAIESTTDTFSSFLVLLGLKYANRPADKNHSYGHGAQNH